jgi:glycosyltransferase involved in cell wall biosynthesis
MGFEPFDADYIAGLTPYFNDAAPYIVYVGRKETGKNVPQLIDFFVAGKDRGHIDPAVKLVIVGAGSFSDLHRPEALKRADIIDLVHVSEEDKHRIIRHSAALCQPSCNESFSIVIMEGWLLGVPVIVHAKCAVTKHHAIESGGGLYFATADDFSGVVSELLTSESTRRALAAAGERYVRSVYGWDGVLARFDTVMNRFFSFAASPPPSEVVCE